MGTQKVKVTNTVPLRVIATSVVLFSVVMCGSSRAGSVAVSRYDDTKLESIMEYDRTMHNSNNTGAIKDRYAFTGDMNIYGNVRVSMSTEDILEVCSADLHSKIVFNKPNQKAATEDLLLA
ncbi:hypothetical protein MKK55_26765 [Methylobacterium sp. J-059]|uniref:hypothetical protein n=1 Tax=Methylobacterium sp. J-059 TaxID=2836643 RepID=UPI001FBBCAB2|nr:hypothetical protein [Methylobacterium sp. J-059]MCJ2042522.1 hypothetical protein [Methylobacterium sp. J-059]